MNEQQGYEDLLIHNEDTIARFMCKTTQKCEGMTGVCPGFQPARACSTLNEASGARLRKTVFAASA